MARTPSGMRTSQGPPKGPRPKKDIMPPIIPTVSPLILRRCGRGRLFPVVSAVDSEPDQAACPEAAVRGRTGARRLQLLLLSVLVAVHVPGQVVDVTLFCRPLHVWLSSIPDTSGAGRPSSPV